jgi:phosphoribosyl 1,2-cyclic phosphodiesterase
VRLQVLASGSGGNATLVRAGELALLIDAGLELDDLERRLAEARMPPHLLDAIALTHGHLDHARSAGLLARKAKARVFCTTAMMSNASVRAAPAFHALAVDGEVRVAARRGHDAALLRAVRLPHDADPTVALRVEHGGRVACVCTDMGAPDPTAAAALRGAHVLVLEFNHDPEMLARGPYSDSLKKRVGGPRGHLSNAQAAQVLRAAAGPELHTLVLAHLSRVNNRPELATASAREALRALGRDDVRVLVADQDVVGPVLDV